MTRSQQPALTLFAFGMIGLGILALVYGDFALVWQPVASWIPGRTGLAYASGLLMLVVGTGLLVRATAAWSARLLLPYLIVWLLLRCPLWWRRRRLKGCGWAWASWPCCWPEGGCCLPAWPGSMRDPRCPLLRGRTGSASRGFSLPWRWSRLGCPISCI